MPLAASSPECLPGRLRLRERVFRQHHRKNRASQTHPSESGEITARLAAIPGDHLEALKGAHKGRHSVRINDQYRVRFVWKDGDAYDVEITDYH